MSNTATRRALVTGANKGIGFAIAAGLGARGWQIGVGARDLRECLLLQLDFLEIDHPLVETIIRDYWDMFMQRHFVQLAKALAIDMKTLEGLVEIIKHLDPKPGRKYSNERAIYVEPDVYVHKVSDEYVIVLLPHPRVVAVLDVVLEIGVVVDLVEGVLLFVLFLRLDFLLLVFRFGLLIRRFRFRLFGLRFFGGFFEERILEELLIEDFLELEFRQLQQLDRLLQRRRHDQFLGKSEVEFLL